MSIVNFSYNMLGEMEYPTVILSTKYHKHLGTIHTIDKASINSNFNLASSQEISFDVYREFDGKECDLWEDIIDFKYIYIPEYQEYYSITITTDDENKTVKHITATSACEAELSSRILYNFECNTESDILREDYVPTIIYNADNPAASLLHRVLKDKCPDYTIKHVDASIAKVQRTFSCDGTDIYGFLTSTVAEEIKCLFLFDSINRGIYVYDLETYGCNTNIHISSENYAQLVTVEGDNDNVFNCLKVSGGDDLITATVANINPNGSNYIYSFSEDMLKDMPDELVEKIASYNALYDSLQPDYKEYTNRIYELIDRRLYLESEMMPDRSVSTTNAQDEAENLTTKLNEVAVQNISVLSDTSADLAVKNLAKVIVDVRYDVVITESSLTNVIDGTYRTWNGEIKITNVGDNEDTATTGNISVKIVGNNYEEYLYQKILKSLEKEDSVFYSIFEIEDIATFEAELKKYSLNRLKSFESSYNTCIDILIENGVTDANNRFYDVDLYNEMYLPYYNRILSIQQEMLTREREIAAVNAEYEQYNALRSNIQKQLDFKDYIGDDLWALFSHYLRESKYSNSNYISDGLNNKELIDKATELFEVAKNEVIKASELQYTISSTLNNLLNIKEFDRFKNQISLGNWINLVADDKLYQLRMIGFGIDYSSPDRITVSFSNVIKVKNAVSDMESVISQAKSMASSYDYVSHQAKQGNEALSSIEDWTSNGLNSALVNITNNDHEEIVYDKHGLIARSYDDITESYSPKQLKITHNVLAFTNDNWLTTTLAVGEHQYTYYDEVQKKFVTGEDYGVSAKFLSAGYVYGSQIIGGDIYSDNYSSTTGTHIDLRKGKFSFAGGKLAYDGNDLSVNGKITATSGKIGNFNLNSALYSGTTSMTSTNAGIYLGADGIRQYKDTTHYVNISNGTLTCVGGSITGSSFVANGSVTKYASDYNTADQTKIQRLIVGIDDTTPQDLERYDFNGDGIITALDAVTLERLLQGLDTSKTINTSIQINPMQKNNIIQTEGVVIGRLGLNAQVITAERIQTKSYYVWTNSATESGMIVPGVTGTFSDQNGQTIRVHGGIITGIMPPGIA